MLGSWQGPKHPITCRVYIGGSLIISFGVLCFADKLGYQTCDFFYTGFLSFLAGVSIPYSIYRLAISFSNSLVSNTIIRSILTLFNWKTQCSLTSDVTGF